MLSTYITGTLFPYLKQVMHVYSAVQWYYYLYFVFVSTAELSAVRAALRVSLSHQCCVFVMPQWLQKD